MTFSNTETPTKVNTADPEKLPLPSDEFVIINDPEQRVVILRRSEEMVKAARDKKMVIFLEKGATPLKYIFTDIWKCKHPNLPLPKLVDINIGTEKMMIMCAYALDVLHFNDRDVMNDRKLINLVGSIDDLRNMFGNDSVNYLLTILKAPLLTVPESRLIVDDIVFRGFTQQAATKILNVADPVNHYSFFTFLESENDKQIMSKQKGYPDLPWRGMTMTRDVESRNEDRFFYTIPETNPDLVAKGEQVVKELKRLALLNR